MEVRRQFGGIGSGIWFRLSGLNLSLPSHLADPKAMVRAAVHDRLEPGEWKWPVISCLKEFLTKEQL